MLMGVVVFPRANFHTLLYKISISRIFSSLSNYSKYLILKNSYLAMKHGSSSLLQFPNYSRTFSVCIDIFDMTLRHKK